MADVLGYTYGALKYSPVLFWRLQDTSSPTLVDSSGNGRDGTQTGFQLGIQDTRINSDQVHYYASVQAGDRASIADAAWMDITGDFSIAAWINVGTLTTNSRCLFGNVVAVNSSADAPSTERFGLAIYDNRIRGLVYDGTTVSAVVSSSTINSVATGWHFIVFTRAGSSLKLYRDGSLWTSGTGTANSTSTASTDGLRIGYHSGGVFANSIGGMSEVALFDSELSGDAVLDLYTVASGVTATVAVAGQLPTILQDKALSSSATVSATATGNLEVGGGIVDLATAASMAATASAAITLAQSLVANAVARASATGSMPTPGPGFGCWTRELRPFARYGRAVMFGYRAYYDDAGALAGAAQSVATASGDLGLTVIGLAGDAVVRVAVTAGLNTGVIVAEQLSGSARVEITPTGDLETDNIQGSAPVAVSATGHLGMRTPLSAEAVARAIAAGTPSVLVPIGGSAAVVEAATGALLARSGLAGSAADVASASAAMVAAMAASGSAASRAAAVASLMIGSSLAGSAAAVGTVTGAVGVGMDLDADARARASAGGATGISTDLSGQARVSAEAAGTLREVAAVTGGITYAVNLSTGAATNLLDFDFERLVTAHGGTLYGLKAGALYAVGGDTDPGSTPIDATVRLAPSDHGNFGQKRLETVYLYTRELDGLTVTPIYDETAGIAYTTIPLNRDGMRASRAHVGRGNAWHTLGLRVANRDGGKFDVGGIEPIVSQLSRKRR